MTLHLRYVDESGHVKTRVVPDEYMAENGGEELFYEDPLTGEIGEYAVPEKENKGPDDWGVDDA